MNYALVAFVWLQSLDTVEAAAFAEQGTVSLLAWTGKRCANPDVIAGSHYADHLSCWHTSLRDWGKQQADQ